MRQGRVERFKGWGKVEARFDLEIRTDAERVLHALDIVRTLEDERPASKYHPRGLNRKELLEVLKENGGWTVHREERLSRAIEALVSFDLVHQEGELFVAS